MNKPKDSLVKAAVVERFRLSSLEPPVNLRSLAKQWGVTSIEEQSIQSDAMLLPGPNGYKVVLRKGDNGSISLRQRFSLAHELGHLLLHKIGYSDASQQVAHRAVAQNKRDAEEVLCDDIAAEILMPQLAFQHDCWLQGWSLRSLSTMVRSYQASTPAVARRIAQLMPEPCVMGIWDIPEGGVLEPKLKWWYTNVFRFGVPSQAGSERLELIHKAVGCPDVQEGHAPVVDKHRNWNRPPVVYAEGLKWGRGQFRSVVVYHYPARKIQPR